MRTPLGTEVDLRTGFPALLESGTIPPLLGMFIVATVAHLRYC